MKPFDPEYQVLLTKADYNTLLKLKSNYEKLLQERNFTVRVQVQSIRADSIEKELLYQYKNLNDVDKLDIVEEGIVDAMKIKEREIYQLRRAHMDIFDRIERELKVTFIGDTYYKTIKVDSKTLPEEILTLLQKIEEFGDKQREAAVRYLSSSFKSILTEKMISFKLEYRDEIEKLSEKRALDRIVDRKLQELKKREERIEELKLTLPWWRRWFV